MYDFCFRETGADLVTNQMVPAAPMYDSPDDCGRFAYWTFELFNATNLESLNCPESLNSRPPFLVTLVLLLKALQLVCVPVLERGDVAFANDLKLAKIGLARHIVEAGWHQSI